MKKKILIISDQPIYSSANQVLFQFHKGLLEDGFCIHFLCDANPYNNPTQLSAAYDLDTVFKSYTGQFTYSTYNPLFGVLSILQNMALAFINFFQNLFFIKQTVSAEKITLPASNQVNLFDGVKSSQNLLSNLKIKIKWASAFYSAKKISKKFQPTIICGFEIGGAVPASKIAAKLRVPLCTKFMGTISYPYIQSQQINFIKQYLQSYSVQSDLVFMLNDGTKGDKVLDYLSINPNKVKFTMDGVDTSRFNVLPAKNLSMHDLKLDIKNDEIICICLSNHNSGWKRLDRAIRAVAVARDLFPKIKLILPGHGTYTEPLKNLSSSLEVQNNILFIDRIPNNKITSIFSLADIYLNTNDQSNLSHTILEAMSAGLAIVSMDDGSLDGIIEHKKNGLLANPRESATQLPEYLVQLCEQPDLRNTLGKNAKRFAQLNFKPWQDKAKEEVSAINLLLKNF